MIKVENISRRYGDFLAVDDVSFTIDAGEIVGLLGHNGAGKTTIMKMLTGFLEPSAGTIEINGRNLEDDPEPSQAELGYLAENLPIYPEMTVMDYLYYCAQVRHIPEDQQDQHVKAAIAKTELFEKALVPIATLSRGFKQRVGVAQALIHNPKFLILDEPTNGLDPHQTHQMRKLIKNLASDATVIISTHIMQEVNALCDRVIILDSGKLAVDQSLDELSKSDKLRLQTSADLATVNNIIKDLVPNAAHSITLETVVGKEANDKVNSMIIPFSTVTDVNTLCSTLVEKLVALKEKVYTLSPVQKDLESVFKEIHESGNESGTKEEAQA